MITVYVRIFIARLLSILAIASFLAGPLATQSAWAGNPAPVAAPMTKMADMPAAVASMECCPQHKHALPDDQKECRCTAFCAASCLGPLLLPADYAVILSWNSGVVAFGDDQHHDRIADPPPPRPPRT